MNTVNKYTFEDIELSIRCPQGAIPLAVQSQGHQITLWMEVDTTKPNESRQFIAIPSGNLLPYYRHYIGTVQQGLMVYHIYETFIGREPSPQTISQRTVEQTGNVNPPA